MDLGEIATRLHQYMFGRMIYKAEQETR